LAPNRDCTGGSICDTLGPNLGDSYFWSICRHLQGSMFKKI
jgi:hypothetical protein